MRFITQLISGLPKSHKISIPWAQLYLIASKLQDEIISRTQGNKDAHGKQFIAYSTGYLIHKRQMMSEGGGFVQSPSKVTLTDSGRMINSIQIKKDGDAAIIYFSVPDRAKIGWYHHNGSGKMPKREWLSISGKQKSWAITKIKDIYLKGIQ